MPRVPHYILLGSCFLLTFCLYNCQSDNTLQQLKLDKTVKNSFLSGDYNHWASEEIAKLGPNETLVFDSGLMRPVSIRAADVDLGATRFRVGLVDANQDGVFTTVDEDWLVISMYGVDTFPLSIKLPSIGKLRKRNFFKVDRNYFMIEKMGESGDQLQVVPWSRCAEHLLVAQLKTCLGKIPVQNLNGEDVFVSTVSPDDNPMLIVVLSYETQKGSFFEALKDQASQWKDQTNVMVVYLSGQKEQVKEMIQPSSLPFPVYFRSRETCNILNCHGTPFMGILVDKHGRVLQTGMRKEDILAYLNVAYEVPERTYLNMDEDTSSLVPPTQVEQISNLFVDLPK